MQFDDSNKPSPRNNFPLTPAFSHRCFPIPNSQFPFTIHHSPFFLYHTPQLEGDSLNSLFDVREAVFTGQGGIDKT